MSSTPEAFEPVEHVGTSHSCEHCSGHGDAAPDPAERAREHLTIARGRAVPRLILGVLGLLIALVVGARGEQPVPAVALVWVAAALAWLTAAWGGVVLGAALGARRGPWARLALGQVLAAALAPALALVLALGLGLAALPNETGPDSSGSGVLRDALPYGVAAAAGWFLAAALAEMVRLRALARAVDRQDETGLQARHEAHGLTAAALQRTDLVALGVALAFGAAVVLLIVLPWAAFVLVPLAAVGAATLGLRQGSHAAAGAEAQRDS